MTSSSDPPAEPPAVPARFTPGWQPVPQPPLTPIDDQFLPLLRFQLDKSDAQTVHLGDFAVRPIPDIIDPHAELRAQRSAERAAAEGDS